MSSIQGTVKVVRYTGKATNIQVDGQWYGCGFGTTPDKLNFKEGDTIQFTYQQKGDFKNIDLKSVQVQAGVPKPAASGGYQVRQSDDSRQRAITWQASRNAAIEVAKLAKELDILPLGTKKNEQLQNLQSFIHDLSVEFFTETENIGKNGLDQFAGAKAEETFE